MTADRKIDSFLVNIPSNEAGVSVTTEIWSAMASATGLSFKEVSEIGRRIREQGLFSKHTRAKESQVITNADLANLTIAVMSGLPAQHTHHAVRRLAGAEVFKDDHKHILESEDAFKKFGSHLEIFLVEGHTFTEALAGFYGLVRSGPNAFEQLFGGSHDIGSNTFVSIDQKRFFGTISIDEQVLFTDPEPRNAIEQVIQYHEPGDFFRGDLEVVSTVRMATIAAVARAADRVAL